LLNLQVESNDMEEVMANVEKQPPACCAKKPLDEMPVEGHFNLI